MAVVSLALTCRLVAVVTDVYVYDFAAVGFDLWTVNNGTIFDNVLVTDSLEYAKSFAESTWGKIKDGEKAAKEKYDEVSKPKEEEKTEEAATEEKKEDL